MLILLAVGTVMPVGAASKVRRPVLPMLAAEYPLGTTMKSIGLMATPRGVLTRTLPDPVLAGTVVLMDAGVGVPVITATELLYRTRLFDDTGSKLAPAMTTLVPEAPMAGVSE